MIRLQSLAILLPLIFFGAISGSAESLKLLVSVQQQDIVAPSPVRVTLHFHNSGQQTIWLYQPVRSRLAAYQSHFITTRINESGPVQSEGGSTIGIQFVALNPPGNGKTEATGRAFVIAPDALPYPRLVRVEPGKDCEEKVSIHVEPAQAKMSGGNTTVWGHYRLSVSYSADYPNAGLLQRDINADLWRGHLSSNAVTLNLQPPTAQGSISGTVLDSVGRPINGMLVTLDDDNENALNQLFSDVDGRFSFTHLPVGRYWVTVRNPNAAYDTSVFRQLDLNQPDSHPKVQIMMLPVESDKADRLLHKPVLFHIVDSKGHPLGKVRLAILWSTGNILENLKTQTDENGFATISLIPGPNFVTLRLHGCRREDRRADVAYGRGVDGFKFVYACAKK